VINGESEELGNAFMSFAINSPLKLLSCEMR